MTREVVSKFVNKVSYEYDSKEWEKFKKEFAAASKKIDERHAKLKKSTDEINKKKLIFKISDKTLKVAKDGLKKLKKWITTVGKAVISLSKKFGKLALDAGNFAAKFGLVTAGAAAGVVYLTNAVNNGTVKMGAFGAAMGLATEEVASLSTVFSGLGYEFDSVIDVAKTMSVVLGTEAVEKTGGLNKALKALNLTMRDFEGLNMRQQLVLLLDSAKQANDQKQAMAAVAKLGGEKAAIMLGYLRSQDDTLRDILKSKEEIYALDEEGTKGANEYFNAWDDFGFVLDGLKRQAFGLLGGALTPLMKELNGWLQRNTDSIKGGISNSIKRVSVEVGNIIEYFKSPAGDEFFRQIKEKADGFMVTLSLIKTDILPAIITLSKSLATVLKPIASLLDPKKWEDAFEWVLGSKAAETAKWENANKIQRAERTATTESAKKLIQEARNVENRGWGTTLWQTEKIDSLLRRAQTEETIANVPSQIADLRRRAETARTANQIINQNRVDISINGANQTPQEIAMAVKTEINRVSVQQYQAAME